MSHSTKTAHAVQTTNVGKRYGSFWALQDCSIDVPQGSITALVGPNGAGKSTLLKLLTGLTKPTHGESMIFGGHPTQTPEFLANVGYLAQEIPLYKQFTPKDYITMGAHLNSHWDESFIRERLNDLAIPLGRPVGKMSGGQRAQVALALALAKKPRLLLLDEPVAALDPLARRDFLTSLGQAVADTELTVVMSSHLLADLEFICDHVILLTTGHVQLCDTIEHVLQTHKLLVGPRRDSTQLAGYTIVHETHTPRQSTLLVKVEADEQKLLRSTPDWHLSDVTIEDVVLAYMEQKTTVSEQAAGEA